MDDQDSGRPSRRKQLRELFRRKGKSSAKGNQGFTSKSDEGPGAPPTQVAGIECRTDLWGAAYEQIQKEDPKLLVAYKKYLLAPKAETDQGDSDCQTTLDNMGGQELERKLQELAECKWKEVKSGPEIVIGDWRINIKNPACKAIHMIIAFQGIIGNVVSVEPHAALAWTGVVAILPLLLNPVRQTDDAEEGLNYIADLLVRYRLVEEAYSEEIEKNTKGTNLGNRIVEVYSYILRYQISVAIQYSRASIIRFCRDVATVDKWSAKTTQIRNFEKELSGILGELSNVKLNNVDRRVMELQKDVLEVLERLSDIQRGLENIDLKLHLTRAKYATWDAYGSEGSGCYGETRKEVLEKIEEWGGDQSSECIFWLSGMAGSGKSTIARTVARRFAEKGELVASFFFKAGQELRGDAGALFTTLATQLAIVMPDLRPSICRAIEKDPHISEKDPGRQWQDLIFEPLLGFKCGLLKSPVLILVIDALDECRSQGSYDSRSQILDLFYQVKNIQNIQVRVFITSRPELEITEKFPEIQHHNLMLDGPDDLANTRRDISIFLEAKLHEVAKKQKPPFMDGWPGNETMQKLLEKAGHLFIYAATICRFLFESCDPNKQVSSMVSNTSKSDLPTKNLDQMYEVIVQAVDQGADHIGYFRTVVGSIIILSESLSCFSLSQLLDIETNVIMNILSHLRSVLSIPDDPNSSIQLYHLSFHDFLLSEKRCTDRRLQIDEEKAHETLFERCLAVMCCSDLEDSDHFNHDICPLKKDIYGFGHPGGLAIDVDPDRLDKQLPPAVQYACRYWVSHWRSSNMFPVYEQKVDSFFRTHLLHWIEALALMGKLGEAVQMIIDLQSLARESEASALGRLIRDAERVVLRSRSGIEAAPLQIYCSALVFAPRQSEVRKLFAEYLPPWISRLPEVEDYWDYSVQSLVGKSRCFPADLAFSSDSRLLFSFSNDVSSNFFSVEIWDASTGVLRDTLPHSRKTWESLPGYSLRNGIFFCETVDQTAIVRDLQREIDYTVVGAGSDLQYSCVSPNRQLLATVHGDEYDYADGDSNVYTVELWDLPTGLPRGALKGELIGYPEIDFSPDGRFVALISVRGGGVKLRGQMESWKMDSSDCMQISAKSPDDRFTVRISTGRVELWDPQTGLRDDRFPHEAQIYAFSPDGHFVALLFTHRVRLWDSNRKSTDYYEAQISPDGQWLVDLGGDGKNTREVIQLWDTTTGELSDCLELSTETTIKSMVFSPDSHVLAAVSKEQIFLWDLNTHSLSCTLIGHDDIQCIAFSPPEVHLLACGGHNSTLLIWNLDRPAFCKTLTDHSSYNDIGCLAFSPDGRLLASARDREVRLWDVAGIATTAFDGDRDGDGGNNDRHASRASTSVLSPDGHILAVASEDGTVRLWTMRELVVSLPPLADRVSVYSYYQNLVFSADSSLLAIFTQRGVVRVWDVGASEIGATLHNQIDTCIDIALRFLPDNRILAMSDGYILFCLWQWRTGLMLRIVQHDVSEGRHQMIDNLDINQALASSPDGQLIAARLRNRIVIVADCTGNWLYTIRRGDKIDCMAISPDNECLAIVDISGVHLLDLKTENLWWSLKTDIDSNWKRIAFSPDRQLLASMDHNEIILWDLHTRRMPQVLRIGESDDWTRQLAFSADGSQLRTNRGMLPLPGASNSRSTIPTDLAAIGEWVTWRMACVLWIPHHLVLNSAVAGNVVAFVPQSGRPIWIRFDLSKRPTDEELVNKFTWKDATGCRFEEA